jgi:hypothetical protein
VGFHGRRPLRISATESTPQPPRPTKNTSSPDSSPDSSSGNPTSTKVVYAELVQTGTNDPDRGGHSESCGPFLITSEGAKAKAMLPDFPALKAEILKITLAKLRHRIDTGDPVLSQVKRFKQHEGQQMRSEQFGGGTNETGFEKVGTEFTVDIADVPTLVGEKFNAKMELMAQELISQSAKYFFKKVGESCDKAGTSIDARGKPVSPELFLDMINTVQMEFDPNGKPTQSFLIHPDMLPAVQKVSEQIENDPELKRKHEEILERQREEWATRESNRKLAD